MTSEILDWSPQDEPRSKLYGDVYFSAEDGLAESRAVFLTGCGLPQAWTGRDRFVVGELGFGTGLNILALMDLWRRTSEPSAHLHIFSVEAHPIDAADAERALSRWPELADLTALLISCWPGRTPGLHRVSFPEIRVTLDVAILEVAEALKQWRAKADAWFLDGFSPALNPAMWRPEVLGLLAERSAPGGRLATFTVAGDVRRGLQAAGFDVTKQPGFGRKRERLEARLPGTRLQSPLPQVAIIGAGIAGASTARALRALGVEPQIYEADEPGAGASGNPAALVMPRLDAGLAEPAKLAAQAFARAVTLYRQHPEAVIATGVLQVAQDAEDRRRHAKIAGSDLFAARSLALSENQGLELADALVVEPGIILDAWTGPFTRCRVESLQKTHQGWDLVGPDGALLHQCDAVILASGLDVSRLAPTAVVSAVRGQASWKASSQRPTSISSGSYVLPTRDGFLFGATHDRDQVSTEIRDTDHERNLQGLREIRPDLAAGLTREDLQGRAAVRATTTDYFPLAGALELGGLFVLGGLGSRGFCWAPLLAEHVAALVMDAPSPIPQDLAALIDPARFAKRAQRRGRNLVVDGD